MITKLYMAIAGLAFLGLVFGAGYWKGNTDGRVRVLADTVKAHQKREGIDDAIGSLDDVSLCIELGGVPDECAQLRGLEETAEGK